MILQPEALQCWQGGVELPTLQTIQSRPAGHFYRSEAGEIASPTAVGRGFWNGAADLGGDRQVGKSRRLLKI